MIKVTFPYPPSVNQLYGISRQGTRFKKQPHRDFFDQVHTILKKDKVKPLEGELEVSITLYRPYDRGDIDGPLKTLLDSMEQPTKLMNVGGKRSRVETSLYGVYKNDKQIMDLHVYKRIDRKNPRVEVVVG